MSHEYVVDIDINKRYFCIICDADNSMFIIHAINVKPCIYITYIHEYIDIHYIHANVKYHLLISLDYCDQDQSLSITKISHKV